MKRTIFSSLVLAACLLSGLVSNAQIERINETITRPEAESHLRFLTADELRGRNTGTRELLIAGRYIAEQFRRYGLTPLGDAEDDFLQQVPLHTVNPPASATVSMLDQQFELGNGLVMVSGENTQIEGPLLYLPDLEDQGEADLKGKVVVSVVRDARQALSSAEQLQLLADAGAVGLIQLYGPGQRFPWAVIQNFLSRERMSVGEIDEESGPGIPHLWVQDSANAYVPLLKEAAKASASISIEGMEKQLIEAYNVVGKVEGTDPELKKEHMIMCAHYDHVGVQAGEGQDSIYNGTRDNGIGTTGLINAAKYFGRYPPKRSVIIIALTSEEKGLLGSQYYVEHPKIPLEETVFAFNIDNSGYTDTEVITLLDTNRTNIDELVYQAASEVGLGVIGDRIPNQNYYERSDQVSFARKGVPAVNFKMAMAAFDERISKYYHRPEDEFHTVDLDYINKYWRAYIRAAELVGNRDKRPYWIKGDKFEEAGNALYKME